MDPEIKRGFEELQDQVVESRLKISNIEAFQKLTLNDMKNTDFMIEDYLQGKLNGYIYQLVGRMIVKRAGQDGHDYLNERKEFLMEKFKSHDQAKKAILDRVQDTENYVRELVDRKLRKPEQQSTTHPNDQPVAMTVEAAEPQAAHSKALETTPQAASQNNK